VEAAPALADVGVCTADRSMLVEPASVGPRGYNARAGRWGSAARPGPVHARGGAPLITPGELHAHSHCLAGKLLLQGLAPDVATSAGLCPSPLRRAIVRCLRPEWLARALHRAAWWAGHGKHLPSPSTLSVVRRAAELTGERWLLLFIVCYATGVLAAALARSGPIRRTASACRRVASSKPVILMMAAPPLLAFA
jgi:hypothetical protein